MLAGLRAAGGGLHKKLIEAAEIWARGQFTTEEEVERDSQLEAEALRAFGLQLVPGPAGQEGEVRPFYLWRENVPAWALFTGLRTQWKLDVNGHEVGLDYAGMEAHMRAQRVRRRVWSKRWCELQAMEHACLAVWREERAQ